MDKNKEFNVEKVTKLCMAVNASLLLFVMCFSALYIYYGVTLMIVYSAVAIIAYALYFIVLKRKHVCVYMWCVYATIIIYMALATISLGYDCGFHLYCMSIIPIIFYSKYMSLKLHTPDPHPLLVSILIIAVNVISIGISIINGPMYIINRNAEVVLLVANTMSVAAFLIYYTKMIVDLVIESENKLSAIANKDLLTNLYSRRYILKHLEDKEKAAPDEWLAMLDVDDFKKINDTYGHNCGDYVLSYIADIMKRVCNGCIISRWGGEEFLIYGEDNRISQSVLEQLRKEINISECVYNNQRINISVTIGVEVRNETLSSAESSITDWIKRTDDRLYYGKNNGKNQVVGLTD